MSERSERRMRQRDRTYLGGSITFDHGQQTLACLVRNLSEDGARFAFSDGVTLPAEVELTIGLQRETRRVRIVWRGNDAVGVSFLRPLSAPNVLPFGPRVRAST